MILQFFLTFILLFIRVLFAVDSNPLCPFTSDGGFFKIEAGFEKGNILANDMWILDYSLLFSNGEVADQTLVCKHFGGVPVDVVTDSATPAAIDFNSHFVGDIIRRCGDSDTWVHSYNASADSKLMSTLSGLNNLYNVIIKSNECQTLSRTLCSGNFNRSAAASTLVSPTVVGPTSIYTDASAFMVWTSQNDFNVVADKFELAAAETLTITKDPTDNTMYDTAFAMYYVKILKTDADCICTITRNIGSAFTYANTYQILQNIEREIEISSPVSSLVIECDAVAHVTEASYLGFPV